MTYGEQDVWGKKIGTTVLHHCFYCHAYAGVEDGKGSVEASNTLMPVAATAWYDDVIVAVTSSTPVELDEALHMAVVVDSQCL